MKICLLAIGSRLDAWINTGFHNYAARLPRDFQLSLKEIPAIKRHKGISLEKVITEESQRLLAAIPNNHYVIALDRAGEEINTITLAQKIQRWQTENPAVCLLVGGPEGLSGECLKKANWVWSLSQLTLPHPLVRVVIAEQIYRAWSIIAHHPYHR